VPRADQLPEPSLIQPLEPSSGSHLPDAPSTGKLQLDVEPTNALVFIDGFLAGSVADVKASGGLTTSAGWHRLEFRAPGYETPAVNVTLDAKRLVAYHLVLRPTFQP
jgi:hypothetical protein